MEEILNYVDYVDYTGYFVDIISNQEEIIMLLHNIIEYAKFLSQPIWFLTIVIIPLYFIVRFLWWFMKQFLQKY